MLRFEDRIGYERARAGFAAGVAFEVKRERKRWPVAAMAATLLAGAAFLHTISAPAPAAMTLAAVGPWTIYNEAKKYLMIGDIDLLADTFRMTFHTSASNAATLTNSTISQITNEIASGNGYSTSGKALTGLEWTAGASAGQFRFSANSLVWTATGGNLANIKFAVIWKEGASAGARKLLCYSQLSTAQFTVTTGNTITINPSSGIFTLA